MNILDRIPEGWSLFELEQTHSRNYRCELGHDGYEVVAFGNTPDEALKIACDTAREYNIQQLINVKSKPCKSPYCECFCMFV